MPSEIMNKVAVMPFDISAETLTGIEEMTGADGMPSVDTFAKNELLGNDNWKKSFFYRSFQRKAAQSARMTVKQYDADGTLSTVTDHAEEYRFIVNSADMGRAENIQILQTFGEDLDVLQTFGARPQIWRFSGVLRNELRDLRKIRVWQDDGTYADVDGGDGDWRNGFVDAYNSHLRASQLVRRGQFLEFALGDMLIYGYVVSLNITESATNDIMSAFSLDFFVRDVDVPGLVEIPTSLSQLEATDPTS